VPGRDLLFALSEASQTEAGALLAAWVSLVDERLRSGFPAVYDLLPHNVVVAADGSLVDVDAKWVVPGIGREHVLRRAALVTGERLARLLDPERWQVSTTRELVALLGSLVGLPPDGGWIDRAVADEARFQASVMVGVPAITATVDVVGALAGGLAQMIERPVVLPGLGPAPQGDTRLEAEITRLLASLHQSEVSRADATTRAGAALAELAVARADLVGVKRERDAALAEAAALRSSASWRLTRPLRAAVDSLRLRRPRAPRP
jgi:hypothetical protein